MKPKAAQAIRQSKNFLEAARLLRSQDLVNQSISMAVHSAIQAKDALCIEFSGKTQRPKSHNQALEELKSTGKVPKAQLTSSVIFSVPKTTQNTKLQTFLASGQQFFCYKPRGSTTSRSNL